MVTTKPKSRRYASDTAWSRRCTDTPDSALTSLSTTEPLNASGTSFLTKHAPQMLHVASWSANVVALKKYWSGFHRPPDTCPVVLPPYSMLPHPPVGQSSLYIHIVEPKMLVDRHPSISVFMNSACPSIDWYSCRWNAAAPVSYFWVAPKKPWRRGLGMASDCKHPIRIR